MWTVWPVWGLSALAGGPHAGGHLAAVGAGRVMYHGVVVHGVASPSVVAGGTGQGARVMWMPRMGSVVSMEPQRPHRV
ncbi:hypothetical protein GA0070617_0977 [Micromonospora yangpuensis]|uniref:Uncharacterized protein n=1 Tax=Micromonospora yangpuensis TaxID=683228 RepID=A0A1C6U419_9ACTN|nr:hypothetical protein GA0070617_0977 [Micromonospora yangpuensis]